MKKFLLISGIITFAFFIVMLTGFSAQDDAVKKAMRQGNQMYESAVYQEALELYETGLNASADNIALNFNAAQAAYLLGEYERAVDYYEKSGDNVEKYLNTGNTFFMIGNFLEESEQKLQCYLQALKYYYDGIVLFPQNVPLKYNYEVVKELADDLLKNMDQENNDQNSGDGDENQEEGEQSQGESSDGQDQDESASEQDQAESSDAQEQEGSAAEQDEDESSAEQSQAEEGENAGEDENSAREDDEGQDNERDAYQQDDEVIELDQEAIERILRMLESQEQESLKNNQEVKKGKDGKNGW